LIAAALAVLLVAVVAGIAIGDDEGQFPEASPEVISGKQTTVDVRDFKYAPENISVAAGTTVTWANYDDADHTATDKDGDWDSGRIKKDGRYSRTFDSAGRYEYICTLHPAMRAVITVR
jgi:plastocyanin